MMMNARVIDKSMFREMPWANRMGGSKRVSVSANFLAVYAADDNLRIVDPDSHRHPVQKGDLLLVDAPRQGNWSFSGATAIVTQLSEI